jgi:23S rRNA pseudouridine1911/1915/1917 synthase
LSATSFTVAAGDEGQTLAALARKHGFAATWSEARRLAARGKLFVDGAAVIDPASRVRGGATVELRATARVPVQEAPGELVHDDSQLVVIDKPSGISSVPYHEKGEPTRPTGEEAVTAMDLVREHWRVRGRKATKTPLHVVHRIDKETSGLLAFAKTKAAERSLSEQFRAHTVERMYLCVVHGALTDRRLESRLVEDRGDGLRGSTRELHRGKRAVTHVHVVEELPGATVCEVRLETGKTHQIRIHLAENGHPLVGERVYIRDYVAAGNEPLPSPRLLLHAATLAVVHPVTGELLRLSRPPPDDFAAAVAALRRSSRR